MRKTKVSLPAALILFAILSALSGVALAEQTLLNTGNIGGVSNGGSSPSFTTTKAYKITYIMTYHWNNARGSSGGTVGLRSSDGKMYGPWSVSTAPGQGGVPNAYWITRPNVVIPPGTYSVIDSEPGTWAQNGGSGGKGMSEVKGEAAALAEIELLFPLGKSPKVFTTGWTFGAKCVSKGDKEEDLSSKVEWSGTGSFSPATGNQSKPTFSAPGRNKITLTCTVGNEKITKDFDIEAVSPDKYATMGMFAYNPADVHGCPACPHPVTGPIIAGSPTVMIKGRPAARKGDPGTHAACCGPNKFTIAEGDPDVLIDGKPAARIGDRTEHCGGIGKIVETKPDIPAPKTKEWAHENWDKAKWQEVGLKLKDPKLADKDKAALRESIRAERLRLQFIRDSVYDELPADWRTREATDRELASRHREMTRRDKELVRRMDYLGNLFR